MIEQCAKMELAGLRHVNFDGLDSSPLTRQEMLVSIKDGAITVENQNELQKEPRVTVFMNMIARCGVDANKLDCKFIVNMCDDIETSDLSAPRLSYTKRDGSCNILIPDAHYLNVCNIVEQIRGNDKDFKKKRDKAIFAGSDTGFFKTADKNQRFQFCYNNRDSQKGKFKITNFVEIDKDTMQGLEVAKIYTSPISIGEQLDYKFIVNINGNSTSWDRLLWTMCSNSICLYVRPQIAQRSWYYHMFDIYGGPVYIDQDSWESTMDHLLHHEEDSDSINHAQQYLAGLVANVENQHKYFRLILEGYNAQYNR